MRLLAVGLSHRTAPVELRESVDFGRAGLDTALHALAARGVSPETVVLSTCNRAEIYAVGDSDAAADLVPDEAAVTQNGGEIGAGFQFR